MCKDVSWLTQLAMLLTLAMGRCIPRHARHWRIPYCFARYAIITRLSIAKLWHAIALQQDPYAVQWESRYESLGSLYS